MSRRINIMIDEDTWRVLSKITPGARSRIINEALRAWTLQRRRRDAIAALRTLREQLPHFSADEVARWVRKERGS